MKTIEGTMRPRLRGIGAAAKALEVSEVHLRLVITGRRESAVLLARVREQFPALLAPGGATWGEWMEKEGRVL